MVEPVAPVCSTKKRLYFIAYSPSTLPLEFFLRPVILKSTGGPWPGIKRTEVVLEDFVSAVLRQLERKNMTVTDLANCAQCSRAYLHNVLHQRQTPTLAFCERIAKCLSMTVRFGPR